MTLTPKWIALVCLVALSTGTAHIVGAGTAAGETNMTASAGLNDADIAATTLDRMTARFGPAATETFTLSDDVGEFRIELLNLFSPSDLKSNPPDITEATWQVSDADNLTVWYRNTLDGPKYLHHMIWAVGTDF